MTKPPCIFLFVVEMEQVPGAQPKSNAFWSFLHQHKKVASLVVLAAILCSVCALVVFVALLGPFALWLGGDPERNRSFHWKPNSYYYYYDDPLNQTDENKVYDSGFWGDFWLHFGSNLGHGAFFALAVILLVASIYAYSVWIPKLWKKSKDIFSFVNSCSFFGAITVIPLGLGLPGLIMEFFSHRGSNSFYVWLIPSIQAGILVIHFFIKYIFRRADKKFQKVIGKKMGIGGAEMGAVEPQQTNQPQEGQAGAQHVVEIEGEID